MTDAKDTQTDEKKKQAPRKKQPAFSLGTSIDIGTMNLVSARKKGSKIQTKRMRDCFLDLDLDAKKMLKLAKDVSYVEQEERLLILGDAAIETANIFGREARRPLAGGLISSSEIDALEVLSILIENVVGPPIEEGEVIYYSIPAAPLDNPGQDVLYHEAVFERILSDLGYDPISGNEALAIIYSECADTMFSGIGISFGSGMTNIAMSYKTISIDDLEFSLQRCLSKNFEVQTPEGTKRMFEVKEGDQVLGMNGGYSTVTKVWNNGRRDELIRFTLKGLSFLPLEMTDDHQVYAKRSHNWSWVEASSLSEGDVVGEPVIKYQGTHNSYYIGREDGANLTVSKSRNLGRFIGSFLGDGSTLLYQNSRGYDGGVVKVAFNRSDSDLIEKYSDIMSNLFGRVPRKVEDSDAHMDTLQLGHRVLSEHLKEKCYNEVGEKVFPLPVCQIPDQMALGIIEGLVDSDGTWTDQSLSFYNTSLPLIQGMHQLLNRFGIRHTIKSREPRTGGVNHKGVSIVGTKKSFTLQVRNQVDFAKLKALLSLDEARNLSYLESDFMSYEIQSVSRVAYGDDVYDLTVDASDHSFASFGMLVHNCGDWIDGSSAKAVDSTASKMCMIKESGLNLMDPSEGPEKYQREREALVTYYRALISYAIDKIAKKFKASKGNVELNEPIPIVISGGTSLATGFLELFQQVFEKKKRRFPIEVSEIRHADDPMTAVAQGLLIQALQEYD